MGGKGHSVWGVRTSLGKCAALGIGDKAGDWSLPHKDQHGWRKKRSKREIRKVLKTTSARQFTGGDEGVRGWDKDGLLEEKYTSGPVDGSGGGLRREVNHKKERHKQLGKKTSRMKREKGQLRGFVRPKRGKGPEKNTGQGGGDHK